MNGVFFLLTAYRAAIISNIKRKETAADKLKAELKLLEWHKLANDAAIKVPYDIDHLPVSVLMRHCVQHRPQSCRQSN